MMQLVRLSSDAFELLANRTSLQERGRGLARAVFVDGKSYTEVGNELGLQRMHVRQPCETIRAVFAEDRTVDAWVTLDNPIHALVAYDLEALLDLLKDASIDELSQVAEMVHSTRLKLLSRREALPAG